MARWNSLLPPQWRPARPPRRPPAGPVMPGVLRMLTRAAPAPPAPLKMLLRTAAPRRIPYVPMRLGAGTSGPAARSISR